MDSTFQMDMNGQGSISADVQIPVNLPHHIQQDLCSTRPAYRQGKKLTAVKVYTVNNESQHLLIYRVPAINLQNELFALCQKFGEVLSLCKLELVEPEEEFTEIYHACYRQIYRARVAKREMDGRSFFGGLLHVCYAPELESVEETRSKLIHRRTEIAYLTGRKRKLRPSSTANAGISQATQGFGRMPQHYSKRLKLDSTEFSNATTKPSELNDPLQIVSTASSTSFRSSNSLHLDHPLPSTSSEVSDRSADPFSTGPYDRPCFYESQQRLELPGREVATARLKKLTPTAVIRKLTTTKTNKIIFH